MEEEQARLQQELQQVAEEDNQVVLDKDSESEEYSFLPQGRSLGHEGPSLQDDRSNQLSRRVLGESFEANQPLQCIDHHPSNMKTCGGGDYASGKPAARSRASGDQSKDKTRRQAEKRQNQDSSGSDTEDETSITLRQKIKELEKWKLRAKAMGSSSKSAKLAISGSASAMTHLVVKKTKEEIFKTIKFIGNEDQLI